MTDPLDSLDFTRADNERADTGGERGNQWQ